jgi:hypothetical protein
MTEDGKREQVNLWYFFVIGLHGKQPRISVVTSRSQHCHHVDEGGLEGVRGTTLTVAARTVEKETRHVHGGMI